MVTVRAAMIEYEWLRLTHLQMRKISARAHLRPGTKRLSCRSITLLEVADAQRSCGANFARSLLTLANQNLAKPLAKTLRAAARGERIKRNNVV